MIRQTKVQCCFTRTIKLNSRHEGTAALTLIDDAERNLFYFVARPQTSNFGLTDGRNKNIVGIPCFRRLSSEYAIGTNERSGHLQYVPPTVEKIFRGCEDLRIK